MTRKQVLSIYKALQKTIKPKTNTNKTHNFAHAVVNIKNGPSRRNNRRRRYVKFNSTIDPFLRSTATSGPVSYPKDSGDKDLVNKLINEQQKQLLIGHTPSKSQRNYPIGYSTHERMQEINYDPRYRNLVNMPNPPRDEMDNVLNDHLLLDFYNSLLMNVQ